MRRLTLIPALILAAVTAPAVAATRVASIGLCADQVVATLLEDDRIAALSHQAGDADLSMVTERARNLPTIPVSAEAVLMTGAEMVAANYFGETKTVAMLERLGITVIRVPSAETFDEVATALRDVGERLGAPDLARALAEDVNARQRALRSDWPKAPVLAAYYRPDGGSAGAGTFVSGAMAAAGMESLATRLGHQGWGRLDLETLVMTSPRTFVVSFFGKSAYSARRAFGRHPLVHRLMADIPVIDVPARLWSCGGWPLIEAAEFLSRQRLEKDLR